MHVVTKDGQGREGNRYLTFERIMFNKDTVSFWALQRNAGSDRKDHYGVFLEYISVPKELVTIIEP